MNSIYKFIKKPIYLILNILITAIVVYAVYLKRVIMLSSYKICNNLSLILLLFAVINVFLVYKNPENEVKTLLWENVSGLVLFAGFIACKIILRG